MKRGGAGLALTFALLVGGCEKDREMVESMEMPDTTMVMDAMHDEAMRDSLLDVMPGGEMVRGDSAAAERLMEVKMGDPPP